MGVTFKGNSKNLAEIIKKLASAKSVEIGWNADAQYPSGHRNGGDYVANVAAINEWGGNWSESAEDGGEEVRQIPPRPFFRTMIAKNKGRFGSDLVEALVANHYDAKLALGQLGHKVSEDLRGTISGWTSPRNAPRTIYRKKKDKPLDESGLMLDSINHWVK